MPVDDVPGGGRALLDFGQARVDLAHAKALFLHLSGERRGPFSLLAHLPGHALRALPAVFYVRAQHGRLGLEPRELGLRLGKALAPSLGLEILRPHTLAQALAAPVKRLDLPLRGRHRVLRRGAVRLERVRLLAQPVQRVHPQADLRHAQVVAEGEVLLRRLRLLLQRGHLELDFADLVVYPEQVFLRARQAALGLLLAVAEAGNARRLLKHLAPLGAFAADYLGDAPLADDRVSVPAEPGVHQQLVHVAEPDLLAVDVIFALAAAVVPARYRDLFGVVIKYARGVVYYERNLREAHCRAFGRPAEDDVLHLAAAERL